MRLQFCVALHFEVVKLPLTRYMEISIGERKNHSDFLERNIEQFLIVASNTRVLYDKA
jgi:hypothetical protein